MVIWADNAPPMGILLLSGR